MRALPASRWVRPTLPLLAGALPALAFPAPSLWWFAYVALVPWLLLLRSAPTGRAAALTAGSAGPASCWPCTTGCCRACMSSSFVLAALLGALWAPWGWLVRRLLGGAPAARPGRRPRWSLLPSGWLMVELVRSWECLGGPWGLLGASQWQVAPALRLASVGGVWLVSFLLVAGEHRAGRARRAARAVPCRPRSPGWSRRRAATAAAWVWAPRPDAARPGRADRRRPARRDRRRRGASSGSRASEELTRQLAGQDVGPGGVGREQRRLRPRRPARTARPARRALPRGGRGHPGQRGRAPLRPARHLQELGAVGPDGPTGDRYDKMRLVPFGEYIPAARCSAGPPRSARRPARTAGAAPSRW